MSVAIGAPRRGISGRLTFGLVAGLIVLALVWTALWFYAARQTAAVVDGWLVREASFGRQWTCPDRQISGYPFQMRLACAEPRYAGRDGQGSVKAFRAHAEIWSPTRITAEADGPLIAQSPDGAQHIEANWSQASVVLSGSPSALRGAAIELDQPNVTLTTPHPQFSVKAGHTLVTLAPSAQPGADDKTFDLHVKLDSVGLPDLDRLTGNDGAVDFEMSSTINALDLGGKATPIERLEDWRASDGTVRINNFLFTKGPIKIAAEGDVSLDPQHRPAGKIDVSMIGMEPLLAALHVPTQMLGFTALLGGKSVGHLEGQGKSIDLPVTLRDGNISIGPASVARLAPLY